MSWAQLPSRPVASPNAASTVFVVVRIARNLPEGARRLHNAGQCAKLVRVSSTSRCNQVVSRFQSVRTERCAQLRARSETLPLMASGPYDFEKRAARDPEALRE